ncbi:MAG: hypothetical protein ACREQE_08760 [Candidatus Binataceae bacterium]
MAVKHKESTAAELAWNAETEILDCIAELERFSAGKLGTAEAELIADFCAKRFLAFVSDLNPIWARMITAAYEETRRNPRQLLGSWVVRTMEEARHINAPIHPYFAVQMPTLAEAECQHCGVTFKPAHFGQKYCSNKCGHAAALAAQAVANG